MSKKRGNRDHESEMLEDFLTILRRWFVIESCQRQVPITRGDLDLDAAIKIKSAIKSDIPTSFRFLQGKQVFVCEFKTPGSYFDFRVFFQMLEYQAAYGTDLLRNKALSESCFEETVMLALVSRFSGKKKRFFQKHDILIEPYEKGVYRYVPAFQQFIIVIDELDLETEYAEILPYTMTKGVIASYW